jgi:hypothetical protein
MKTIILILFCIIGTNAYAQKTPEFYFQKNPSEVIHEFQKDSVFKIKKTSNYIDVYCTTSNWAMKFFYNQNNTINLIVFATADHETAQAYFDYQDSTYQKHIIVEDYIQWSNLKNIVTFKFQNQSPYPYQFTYSIYEKK